MNQQTKPSAGALRAAKAIGTALHTHDVGTFYAFDGMAKIIDRETGVAELLEAAKVALQYFRGKHENADASASKLQQAIAKAEQD
jgi:hypothetical protein